MKSFFRYLLISRLDHLKYLLQKEPCEYQSSVTPEMIALWKSQIVNQQNFPPVHQKEIQESCKRPDSNEKPLPPPDVYGKQPPQHSELPEMQGKKRHFCDKPLKHETDDIFPGIYPTIFGGGILGLG